MQRFRKSFKTLKKNIALILRITNIILLFLMLLLISLCNILWKNANFQVIKGVHQKKKNGTAEYIERIKFSPKTSLKTLLVRDIRVLRLLELFCSLDSNEPNKNLEYRIKTQKMVLSTNIHKKGILILKK